MYFHVPFSQAVTLAICLHAGNYLSNTPGLKNQTTSCPKCSTIGTNSSNAVSCLSGWQFQTKHSGLYGQGRNSYFRRSSPLGQGMRSRKQLDLLQRQKITEIITASWPHLILLILCLLGRARSILWGAEEVCTLAEAILHFSPALQKNWGNLSSRLHCRDLCSTEFHGSFDESCFFSLKFWWIWPFISNALYDISVSCTFWIG